MKYYIRFVIVWVVNSLVIYAASMLYPTDLVLGNYRMAPIFAALVTGFGLTFITRIFKVLLQKPVAKMLKGRYGMMVFYWLANSVGVWILARLAPVTGFGITAFYWAFGLGVVLVLVQWATRQALKAGKLI